MNFKCMHGCGETRETIQAMELHEDVCEIEDLRDVASGFALMFSGDDDDDLPDC